VARGFGRFKVLDPLLTDGIDCIAIRSRSARSAVIGLDAPRTGFPDFDWNQNRGTWQPAWRERAPALT
jgi:hypothetical protein